jgi:hypothetical protein
MADFVRIIAEIELSRANRHADAEVERETAVSRAGQVPGRQETVPRGSILASPRGADASSPL